MTGAARDLQAEQDHAEWHGWMDAQGYDFADDSHQAEAFAAGMQAQRDLAATPAQAATVTVNVAGTEVAVEVREGWSTLAPVTTAARWLADCGALPFDNFEVRDADGRLLDPYTRLGDWLNGRTIYVNRLAGIGG